MAAPAGAGHSDFSQYRRFGRRGGLVGMENRRFRALALLAATVPAVLLGCAAGPHYVAPAVPAGGFAPNGVPDHTAAAPVHGGEMQTFVAGRDLAFEWWELFQSPAINALIEQALAANPTLTAAHAALAQAQELVAAQRGFYFPTIAAVYQAERHKVSGNTNSSQTIGVQGNGENKLPQIPETPAALQTFPHNQPSYYSFYTAELSVGFVPDVFGGNRRQVESLAAQAEAERYALAATYITLASNVAAAAIQAAEVRAEIETTDEIVAADRRALEVLRDQLRLGYAMRIDVAAQEAALADVEMTLPPLQKQLDQTLDLLRALVGTLPNAPDRSFALDEIHLPVELPLELPAKLIEQRPDVRAAAAQLHTANANVGVTVAAMLPEVSISAQYGGNATQMNRMFAAGGPFWNLVGDVTQPVFQGGTLLHMNRAARAALRQAAALYRLTVIAAYQNVADALHQSLADATTLAADATAERAAKLSYELTQRQYDAGYVPLLQLLAAETAYRQTVLTRIQAQAARFGDTVALFQALGGGWWNRPELAAR
jgi:NodT family efflux transporter outer membrane factor (OMF) lipoprotein